MAVAEDPSGGPAALAETTSTACCWSEHPGRRGLTVLRAAATAHVVAIFGQPVSAGRFLTGDYDMLRVHALGGIVVLAVGLAQFVAAAVLAWRGGPRWPSLVSLTVALGEWAQFEIGQAGALDLHLPLGVALVTTTGITAVALWRPQPRTERRAPQ